MMVERSERSRFGDLLLEMRLVEEGALSAALAEQRSTGRRLARILADRRVLDEERLTKAVGAKLGLETVSLDKVRIHPRVLARLPGAVARFHGMLPYAVKRTPHTEVLYLVMSDPLDAGALAEAQRQSGCQIRVMLASASALDQALDEHYGRLDGPLLDERPESRTAPLPRPASRAHAMSGVRPETDLERPEGPEPLGDWTGPDGAKGASHRDAPMRRRSSGKMSSTASDPALDPRPAARDVTLIDLPPEPGLDGPRLPPFLAPDVDPLWKRSPDGLDADPTRLDTIVESTVPYEAPKLTVPEALLDDRTTDGRADEAKTEDVGPRDGPEESSSFSLPAVTSAPRPDSERGRPRPMRDEEVSDVLLLTERVDEGPPLALEIPVDCEERSHPFVTISPIDVPVGLGETGIMPHVDVGTETFELPPIESFPEDPKFRRGLTADDIPKSQAEVQARRITVEVTTSDDIDSIEEIALDPLELPEAHVETGQGAPEPLRVEPDAPSQPSELVRAALVGAAAPRPPTPKPAVIQPPPPPPSSSSPSRSSAERLVEALESGASLTSSDRARLVLAVARVLLAQGILPREALIEELEA